MPKAPKSPFPLQGAAEVEIDDEMDTELEDVLGDEEEVAEDEDEEAEEAAEDEDVEEDPEGDEDSISVSLRVLWSTPGTGSVLVARNPDCRQPVKLS